MRPHCGCIPPDAPPGCTPADAPPPRGQTDAYENITFPHTTYAVGNEHSVKDIHRQKAGKAEPQSLSGHPSHVESEPKFQPLQ